MKYDRPALSGREILDGGVDRQIESATVLVDRAVAPSDLFRRGVIECKARITPRPSVCRWCGRRNYHLQKCARVSRLAGVNFERPKTGQFANNDERELRWCYLLELALAGADEGAPMP